MAILIAACLRELPRATAFIARQIEAAKAVLVHCAWGRDRTGIALATYLASHQGFSAEDAIAKAKRVQAEALSAEGWEAIANRVISRLS